MFNQLKWIKNCFVVDTEVSIYNMAGDWLQFFLDFNQGVGSLLSARGQGILSLTGDDNFIVEDRATSSHEVFYHF